jgi:glycerate kinase
VTNPSGEEGASAVFGPQKGPRRDDRHPGQRACALCEVIARDLDIDVLNLAGGGGGRHGRGAVRFCGAQLRQGIEIVTDALHLADQVADADLVITGEGRIDSQTIHGKVRWAWRRWRNALTNRYRHCGQPDGGCWRGTITALMRCLA